MKAKKIILICVAAVLTLSLTYLILNKTTGFDIKLNIIKYETLKDGDLTVKFYGSRKTVRRVKIKDASTGETSKLDYYAKSDIFSSDKDILVYEDINFDGARDLLILCADEADGDLRYAAYILDTDKNRYLTPETRTGKKVVCLSNYTVNWETLTVTSEETKVLTEPATNMKADIDFERRTTRTEYKWTSGKFIVAREQRLSYFFLEDHCSYGLFEDDGEELVCIEEKWFEPDKIKNYPFQ